jgi:hypothetical protein
LHVTFITSRYISRKLTVFYYYTDYGFSTHCSALGCPDAVDKICEVFTYLSPVAILWDSVLCLHGFLCQKLESNLWHLETEQKPDPEDFERGSLLEGITWSDLSYMSTPTDKFTANYLRRVGNLCTLRLARDILARLGITAMFRAHQHVEEGYAAYRQIYTINSNTVREDDIATVAKLTKGENSKFSVVIQYPDSGNVIHEASHDLKATSSIERHNEEHIV